MWQDWLDPSAVRGKNGDNLQTLGHNLQRAYNLSIYSCGFVSTYDWNWTPKYALIGRFFRNVSVMLRQQTWSAKQKQDHNPTGLYNQMGMVQKAGMDRSAVIRTHGTSELRIRGFIVTYWEGILEWPGISTTCHFQDRNGSRVSIISLSDVWFMGMDRLVACGLRVWIGSQIYIEIMIDIFKYYNYPQFITIPHAKQTAIAPYPTSARLGIARPRSSRGWLREW